MPRLNRKAHQHIALLRAVNVGGTGKLPMQDLVKMCDALGFKDVQTYIASGNVLFSSILSAQECRQRLEQALEEYVGKPVTVFMRNMEQLEMLVSANPFADKAPNRTMAIFLDTAPTSAMLENIKGHVDEEVVLGSEHLYVHYGEGMAKSKLVIPVAKSGTARNMNTVMKLLALAKQRAP